MDFERWNEKFAGFSVFINSLQEQLKPYAEEWKAVEQNAKSLLIDFTEKTKPLRAFNILADHQFTYWNPLQSDDVEKILNSYDVDQYLLERIEDKGFIDYDTLCKEMESSELLSATNKSILQQTVKAIEAELYDLALAGAVIVFDGVLTEATSNACLAVFRILRKEVSDSHGFNMDPPIKIKRYIRMGISSHVFHLDPGCVTVHEITQGRFFVPFPDSIRIGRF